ncbi:MAG: DUF2796 domain-containing protein [Pseudomonadota bacterium]
MTSPAPLMVAILIAAPAFADETRQLDAHEHGVGELNMAIDGTTVAIELHAPGADIVGFEYAAKSAEDRAAIETAIATLSSPLTLFQMPAAAECTVTQAAVALESEEAHDEHGKGDHGHGHSHDHDHGHEAAEAEHTEFNAQYVLDCARPSALTSITFAYFDTFENAREIELQIVSASGAQAFEVDRDAPVLTLEGLF